MISTARIFCCRKPLLFRELGCSTKFLSLRASYSTSTRTSSFRHRIRELLHRPAWRRIALAVRYTRIPFLIVGVYSLGYQQGIVDAVKTPIAVQTQILDSILLSMGASMDSVEIIQETMLNPRLLMNSKHAQIAQIGHKIVCAARELVEEELQAAMDSVNESLPADATTQQTIDNMLANEQVVFWQQARFRLQGEQVMKQPWQYVLIDSSAANAFVTEILPQRFFITSAMLGVATTPHELAVVLGHEVSHLILGHVSETNKIESILRTLEILLLSLDPTSGVVALGVIAALASARRLVSARHSQRHEYEADDLGLKLAARACFDTAQGSHVMRKMNKLRVAIEPEVKSKAVKLGRELLATHPPSIERFERMQQQALEENFSKYRNCTSVSTRIYNGLWKAN